MSNEQLHEIITKALDSFAKEPKHGPRSDGGMAMATARQFAQHILDHLEERGKALASANNNPLLDLHRRKLTPHAKGCQYIVAEDWAFCPKCGASLTPDVHLTIHAPISTLMTVEIVAGTEGKDYGNNSDDGTLEIMYSPEIEEGLIALFIDKHFYASAKLSKASYGELLLWAKQQ